MEAQPLEVRMLVRASDGSTLGTFTVTAPSGIAFDGANMWIESNSTNKLTKR